MRKLFFLTILLCSAAMVFAGGQQGQTTENGGSGATLDLSKRGSIRVISRMVTTVVGENAVIDMLAEKFNMDIDWEIKASTGYDQATMVILSSGDYPDIMEAQFAGGNSGTEREITALYEDKILAPLNGLLQQYGKNIEAARPYRENWLWMEDGERVSIPSRFVDIPESWVTIRQDWLDNLGLKMPVTLDEVTDVARAFTFNDPDRNGKHDTVGLAGPVNTGSWTSSSFMVALGAFGETMDWEKVGDRWEPWQIRPGTREAIKWYRERYQEGVVEKDFMTMTRDQYIERKNLNQYGIEWWWSTHMGPSSAWWNAFNANIPEQKTAVLLPVSATGYNGVHPFKAGLQSWGGFTLLLFAQTKEAARVISMVDYLATDEGADLAAFGPRGKSWELVDGAVVFKDISADERLSYGVGALNTFFWKNVLKRDTEPFVLETIKSFPLQFNHIQDFPAYTGDTSALGSLANEALVGMIVNPNVNVDAAFTEFRAEYLRMGGQGLVDYMTSQFNATLK